VDYLADLCGGGLFAAFQHFVQLAALEILQDDVNGVLGFVDAFEFHEIGVGDSAHEFYLVFE
jgi:hypothetical protein